MTREARHSLIDSCKGLRSTTKNQRIGEKIETLQVNPVTLFQSSNEQSSVQAEKQVVVNVFTQNQGLAPSAKTYEDKNISVFYARDQRGNQNLEQLKLLYETYIEGQALKFKSQCHFTDLNGNQVNCTKDGIIEEVNDVPYNFSIEFATSNRKIVKQFALGKLFFMFDTLYNLNVLRLPKYQQNLGPVNGYPLRRVDERNQNDTFGCQINGYHDYFNLTGQVSKQNESFLYIYHCNSPQTGGAWMLRAAVITAYNDAYDDQERANNQQQRQMYDVVRYQGEIHLPYQIIDIEKIDISDSKIGEMKFILAVTCKNEGSETTNILVFYKLHMVKESGYSLFMYMRHFSAYNLRKDTFMVTKLLTVKSSRLLFVVAEEKGLYIFNYTQLENQGEPRDLQDYIHGEINIYDDIMYREQNLNTISSEPFAIKSFTFNFPTSLMFVTNYGIFIYEYPVDLNNEQEISKNPGTNLKGKLARQIALPFDQYNGELVQNPYGNAFLIKRIDSNSGVNVYRTILVALSYFSAENSQVFKMIDVVQQGPANQCIALNQLSYFEMTPEDQLAVTFICNQFLYIYRVCMRPHVIIDLQNFAKIATNEQGKPGLHQFNYFNITIDARNEFTEGDLNRESIEVNVHYRQVPFEIKQYFISFAILLVSTLILYVVFYVDYKYLSKKVKDPSKQKKNCRITQLFSRRSRKCRDTSIEETSSDYRLTKKGTFNSSFSQSFTEGTSPKISTAQQRRYIPIVKQNYEEKSERQDSADDIGRQYYLLGNKKLGIQSEASFITELQND